MPLGMHRWPPIMLLPARQSTASSLHPCRTATGPWDCAARLSERAEACAAAQLYSATRYMVLLGSWRACVPCRAVRGGKSMQSKEVEVLKLGPETLSASRTTSGVHSRADSVCVEVTRVTSPSAARRQLSFPSCGIAHDASAMYLRDELARVLAAKLLAIQCLGPPGNLLSYVAVDTCTMRSPYRCYAHGRRSISSTQMRPVQREWSRSMCHMNPSAAQASAANSLPFLMLPCGFGI